MAKVNLEITGKDKGASAAVKGVTGSIITAQLAVEAIKIATKALIDIGKKSIEAWKIQEQVLAKLNVQTNGNTASIEKWTTEIQKATTVGDEAAQQIASIGLSMGITQDKLESATKGAIGLSEAFGIDLNTSMKMVSQANEGQYTMLARYIPSLKTASTDAEKMVIVQNAMSDGFDLAKAKAETFTGRLEQLKNAQGDTLESFGKVISVIGKDYVDGLLTATQGINDFLTNVDNIAGVTSGFAVFTEILKKLFDVIKDIGSGILQNVKDGFKKLSDEADGAFNIFSMLGNATQILSSALKIVGSVINGVITTFFNLVKIGKNAFDTVGSFISFLKGETKFEDVKNNFKDLGGSIKDYVIDMSDSYKEVFQTTISEGKKFNENAKKQADDYNKIWKEKNEQIRNDFAKSQDELLNSQEKGTEDSKENLKEWTEAFKNSSNYLKDLYKETGNSIADGSANIFDSIKNAFSDIGKVMTDATTTPAQKTVSILQSLAASTSSILGSIQGMFADHYNTLLEQNNEWKDSQLESVDDWIEREMEAQGVRLETKQELLQQEIDQLNEKLAIETDAQAQADLQKSINEKQAELTRQQILDEGEKKKYDIQKKAKDKETKLKKQQFEENKAFQIANIWINAASAVIGWWAAFAGMGIPGIVLAGVMTGVTLAMAGVQTGLVASQTFHGAEGGEIPTGTMSGDRAVTYMNKGEALLQSNDYKSLVNMARVGSSGGSIYIENVYVQSNNAQDFIEQMIEIQRREATR